MGINNLPQSRFAPVDALGRWGKRYKQTNVCIVLTYLTSSEPCHIRQIFAIVNLSLHFVSTVVYTLVIWLQCREAYIIRYEKKTVKSSHN